MILLVLLTPGGPDNKARRAFLISPHWSKETPGAIYSILDSRIAIHVSKSIRLYLAEILPANFNSYLQKHNTNAWHASFLARRNHQEASAYAIRHAVDACNFTSNFSKGWIS